MLGIHVSGEEGLEGEAVTAGAAGEGPDGGVLCLHVRLERHLGVEDVVAVLALVTDVFVLRLDVLGQSALDGERLAALPTGKRLLPCVEPHVVLDVVLVAEALVAEGALKLRVRVHTVKYDLSF